MSIPNLTESDKQIAHTPGPWTLAHARRLLRSDKECDYGRREIDDPIVEANARLIAAAPDLLAICQQLEKEGEGRVQIAPDLRGALRAAIVKAEKR